MYTVNFCSEGCHKYVAVSHTWQTIDPLQYQKLEHSEQVMVCARCGSVVNPWPEVKVIK